MNSPTAGPAGADHGIFALPVSILRRIWRDASWSLGGNLLTVFSGLATLKIVGWLVPAAEYGAASLVLGLCALLNQFIAGPLLSERLRLYFDHLRLGDTRPLARVIQGLLLRVSTLMAGIYLAIAAVLYYRGQAIYLQLLVPVLIMIFMQPQLLAAFNQMEAHRNYRGLSLVQPLLSALQVPLLLALMWFAVRGSVSIVLAQALAALLVFSALAWRWRDTIRSTSDGPQSSLAQSSISSFGWSLYASNFASWVMTTGDRYLIDYYVARSDVGIYVINYAFWSIPYIVLNGWIHSFSRPRLYARAADEAWDRVLRVVLATLAAGAGIAIAGTVLIYFVGKPLVLWVLGEKYWHSTELMMLLAVAHIFFLIGHACVAYFFAIKNTHVVWTSCVIVAMLNVGVNIMLLPKWGLLAAGYATLATYSMWSLILLGGMLYWSRRMPAQPPVKPDVSGVVFPE